MVSVEIQIAVKNLHPSFNGLVIAQLTDAHCGLWVREGRMQESIDFIKNIKPDLIVLTGDMIDRTVEGGHPCLELSKSLTKIPTKYGLYTILGNHDNLMQKEGREELLNFFSKANITCLVNSNRKISHTTDPNASFYLIGIDDP